MCGVCGCVWVCVWVCVCVWCVCVGVCGVCAVCVWCVCICVVCVCARACVCVQLEENCSSRLALVPVFYVVCVLLFPDRDLTFNVDGSRKKGNTV